MTKRDKNGVVYEIDRDDALSNFLYSQRLNMTDDIFFEFEYNNIGGVNTVNIVAGVDYTSEDVSLNDLNYIRHYNICKELNIPYFVVQLSGCIDMLFKKITTYHIVYESCNVKAQEAYDSFCNRFYIDRLSLDEQEYSNFLHTLRRISTTELVGDTYKPELYYSYLTYNKILRERHQKFGDSLYQTDIDLILYSNTTFKPILIVEFKSNESNHNLIEKRNKGQAAALEVLGDKLKIPAVQIYHWPYNLNEYVILYTYTKHEDIYIKYGDVFKENKISYSADELMNRFRYLSETR